LILVDIYRAWKNEIIEGSIPVGPGGTITSHWEIIPTLAAVLTLLDSIMGLSSKAGTSEKMRPILPLVYSMSTLSWVMGSLPNCSKNSLSSMNLASASLDALRVRAFLMTVFLPITRVAPFSSRFLLIFWT